MDAGHEGVFHADNGDAYAQLIRADVATQDDVTVDRITVLADVDHGSGLSTGWNVREAKREDAAGGWTPS